MQLSISFLKAVEPWCNAVETQYIKAIKTELWLICGWSGLGSHKLPSHPQYHTLLHTHTHRSYPAPNLTQWPQDSSSEYCLKSTSEVTMVSLCISEFCSSWFWTNHLLWDLGFLSCERIVLWEKTAALPNSVFKRPKC